MRLAVISDIHGNRHALEAVLEAIDGEHADTIWCLGDLVGYGPQPNACCDIVRERAELSLAGNHDLGVLGHLDLEEFSPDAAQAARWTRTVLSDDSREFLESLESCARGEGVELFHASPRDPVWEYVLSFEAALDALELTSAPIILVGHSHVPLAIGLEGQHLRGGHAPAGSDADLGTGRWLLNPGSVGQPRDGDPRAAYLLLDLERGHAVFRRVDYPIERTQVEILDQRLPVALASRLASGT